ncbi:MAG: multicopper oxidase, type 2 [Bryobacterales bacterium]|nr:multicopper oxidase, type 2 [Bryobacterales bacterium]
MTRREMLALAGCGTLAWGKEITPDITLRIGEIKAELAPGRFVKTLAYNGQVPGPLLRMSEGKQVAVEVVNETNEPEMVHWHGFHIPSNVDGAHEEGTPMVQGRDRRTYAFTPRPSGTRWYHTHAMAGHNLRKGAYSGQYGIVIVEPRDNPGGYDSEVPIVLHEWDPYFSTDMDMDVDYKTFSINGKILGAGEPVRVQQGRRVLFRIVNASATMQHRLALPGHSFDVVALDGNAITTPRSVPVVELAPGERADAIVRMSNPGVWILGEEDNRQRNAGAGIVIEYANAKGPARWVAPPPFNWDYSAFGGSQKVPEPDAIIPVVIEPRNDGNLWAINGKSFPNTDPLMAHPGARNRLIFDNRSDMAHPVHLHRHTFELTRFAGKSMSGVFKDVVTIPARKIVEVDFTADNPGPSLFHCHHQFHMDFGFMALMQY